MKISNTNTWNRAGAIALAVMLPLTTMTAFDAGAQARDSSTPPVKLSPDGLCYGRGDPMYAALTRFSGFASLHDCEERKPQCAVVKRPRQGNSAANSLAIRRMSYLGCLKAVRMLLTAGTNANANDPSAYSDDPVWRANPVDLAMLHNHGDVVELLREHRGDASLSENERRYVAQRLFSGGAYDGSLTSLGEEIDWRAALAGFEEDRGGAAATSSNTLSESEASASSDTGSGVNGVVVFVVGNGEVDTVFGRTLSEAQSQVENYNNIYGNGNMRPSSYRCTGPKYWATITALNYQTRSNVDVGGCDTNLESLLSMLIRRVLEKGASRSDISYIDYGFMSRETQITAVPHSVADHQEPLNQVAFCMWRSSALAQDHIGHPEISLIHASGEEIDESGRAYGDSVFAYDGAEICGPLSPDQILAMVNGAQ